MDEIAWRAPVWSYPLILLICVFFLYSRAFVFGKTPSSASVRLTPAFLAFQQKFLIVFFLSLVANELQNVFSEAQYKNLGFRRKDIALLFFVGHASGLTLGTLVSISADCFGRKKISLAFGILQILQTFLKRSPSLYTLVFSHIFHGLASSILYSAYESWMITEHEKNGLRQDLLGDTFWVMSFGGAITSLGSISFANLLTEHLGFGLATPSAVAGFVALLCVICISKSWTENFGSSQGKYLTALLNSFDAFHDKKVMILGMVQASFDISVSVFWLLWLPTIVADGRDIHGGSIFACLLSCILVGSTISSLLICGSSSSSPSSSTLRIESFLPSIFLITSLCLMVPAYDYQEIGVLVATFCAFNICVGFLTPCLARLRSIYIPNDRRAGVLSLYHLPLNIALMFFLLEGAAFHVVENSVILSLCSMGLLAGAGGLYVLNSYDSKFTNGDDLKQHHLAQ